RPATSAKDNVASIGSKVAPSAAPVAPAARTAQPTPVAVADSTAVRADRSRILGSESAPVWVIEISDFQCPYCKQWHDSTFAKLDSAFIRTGKVRLAYLNFPLTSIHKNAQLSAEAAMCGSAQGKFWEMHRGLFDTQSAWEGLADPMPAFTTVALKSGVDEREWNRCVTTHATAALIDNDRERVSLRGVRSTPSFFVGDQPLEGALPWVAFRAAIETALRKAQPPR
ncbi:MAG: thioredoxin domain-containing protein, partial [Gemmatimonadaceae bacterium]|nr:thioredoxin domain-containing protein [Gemmatimonadaceae bacterium]